MVGPWPKEAPPTSPVENLRAAPYNRKEEANGQPLQRRPCLPPLSAIKARLTSIAINTVAEAHVRSRGYREMMGGRPTSQALIGVAHTVLSVYPEPDTYCYMGLEDRAARS